MNDTFRRYLANGQRAGQAYELAVPRHAPWPMVGTTLANRAGSSLEFMDHRDYHPGDDLRRIDWNAYARSDKLTVKLYREEVNPHLDILIDGSRSMALPDTEKAHATLGLAGALAGAAANTSYSHCAWITRAACEKVASAPLAKMLAGFTTERDDVVLLGRETILRNGEFAGYLTSGGYGYTVGRPIGYGYVRNAEGVTADYIRSGSYELVVARDVVKAHVHLEPLHDPSNARVKS